MGSDVKHNLCNRNYEELISKIFENVKNDKLLVMGVGNDLKGDDGFGVEVVRFLRRYYTKKLQLQDKFSSDIDNENISENDYIEVFNVNDKLVLLDSGVVPENFTDLIKNENPSKIIIVDAALMHKEFGTVDLVYENQLATVGFSTHALPLSILIKYIKSNIDTDVSIVGFEPYNLEFGSTLSKEADLILQEFSKQLVSKIDDFLNF
ncbi:hydrogenase maturation peptidase HycI [Methanococcus voltae]|uniref:Hydrogenase maturation protease HycI n=1 Tax=Methanococcus voltae (strain ATCC BAA-1334 / A3) TaxID=456320 RepID=D7DU49_METV3|nr:hydrogenase maturation peptidase HycI [Methanococcus voltae]MCS3900459.1 hydrogenase 3 maturation protease [Methanococcus voltae]